MEKGLYQVMDGKGRILRTLELELWILTLVLLEIGGLDFRGSVCLDSDPDGQFGLRTLTM